jgi:hypothetical protein
LLALAGAQHIEDSPMIVCWALKGYQLDKVRAATAEASHAHRN